MQQCYNAKDPLEEVPIAMIKIQPIIQTTVKLMRLKNLKKDIATIIDAEDEVISKEFQNKEEVELSSVLIGATNNEKALLTLIRSALKQ